MRERNLIMAETVVRTLAEAYARESEVDDKACVCVARHINAMVRQNKYRKTADLMESCQDCPKIKNGECDGDWIWNVIPIFKKADVFLNLSPKEY